VAAANLRHKQHERRCNYARVLEMGISHTEYMLIVDCVFADVCGSLCELYYNMYYNARDRYRCCVLFII